MGGDVYDVVGPGHHVNITVDVDQPGIGGLIEAGKGAQISGCKLSSACHNVGSAPGGNGNLTASAPVSPGSSSRAAPSASASSTRTSQPGTARVHEPCLTGSRSIPRQLAPIGQPVSVCHQWSITGIPSCPSAQATVGG